MRRSWVLVAVGVPCAVWIALAVPNVMFIWRALGQVGAQHAFLSEVGDYVAISFVFSLVGSLVVLPLALWVAHRRRVVPALVLAVVSLLAYAVVHFMSIATYSLRIT